MKTIEFTNEQQEVLPEAWQDYSGHIREGGAKTPIEYLRWHSDDLASLTDEQLAAFLDEIETGRRCRDCFRPRSRYRSLRFLHRCDGQRPMRQTRGIAQGRGRDPAFPRGTSRATT